jgi:hypothetical protein
MATTLLFEEVVQVMVPSAFQPEERPPPRRVQVHENRGTIILEISEPGSEDGRVLLSMDRAQARRFLAALESGVSPRGG